MNFKEITILILVATLSVVFACTPNAIGEAKNAGSNNNAVKKDVAVASNEKEPNKNIVSPIENKETNSIDTKITTPDKDRVEKRCGWFSYPDENNMYLFDKDGKWVIREEGGYQLPAEDLDNLPHFGREQWGSASIFGYGCACLNVKVNKKEKKILSIKSGTAFTFTKCRKDKNLQEP